MNPAFIQGIGPLELIIVLVVVLLIFGPKRLPALARSAGAGLRELKASIGSRDDDDEPSPRDDEGAAARPALGRAEEPVTVAPSPEAVPERR